MTLVSGRVRDEVRAELVEYAEHIEPRPGGFSIYKEVPESIAQQMLAAARTDPQGVLKMLSDGIPGAQAAIKRATKH